jgi:hypothetical protein
MASATWHTSRPKNCVTRGFIPKLGSLRLQALCRGWSGQFAGILQGKIRQRVSQLRRLMTVAGEGNRRALLARPPGTMGRRNHTAGASSHTVVICGWRMGTSHRGAWGGRRHDQGHGSALPVRGSGGHSGGPCVCSCPLRRESSASERHKPSPLLTSPGMQRLDITKQWSLTDRYSTLIPIFGVVRELPCIGYERRCWGWLSSLF